MLKLISHSEEETILAGKNFSQNLSAGNVVALFGDLGSGKTRFAKGISVGLGIAEHVTSPTFTIVNEHTSGRIPLFHFDFYRMRSLAELDEIGFEEYLFGNGICIIEWADIVQERLPKKRYDIFFEQGNSHNERIICIERRSE